jgi:hypothetical protein
MIGVLSFHQGPDAQTTPMFLDESDRRLDRSGTPRAGSTKPDPARRRYAKKSVTQQPAKLAHARIALD